MRCDLPATRTQIYLTEDQRRRLEARIRHDGKSMAAAIREALEAYLAEPPDPSSILEETFESLPELEVPSRDEFDRG